VNNANALTIGGMMVSPHIATLAVDAWLNTNHTEGMENTQDFLNNALKEIAKIEDANFN
jgi:ribose 5-phosphate isomerase RpiB